MRWLRLRLRGNAGLWFAGELVHAVVVFRVVKGVGGHHVLDFDGDVLEVPRLDASSTQILDHAVNTGVDVVLVLSTGAHGTAGAEHEDGQFWLRDTVDDTGKLLGLVFAVELDGNVGEVEFFSNTGAGNYVNDGKAFFIGGHIKAERPLVYKRNFGASHGSLPRNLSRSSCFQPCSIRTPSLPIREMSVRPPASSMASLVCLGSRVSATMQPPPPAPVSLTPSEEGMAA